MAGLIYFNFGIDWPTAYEIQFHHPFASKPAYVSAPTVLITPPILGVLTVAIIGVVVPIWRQEPQRSAAGAVVLAGFAVFVLALGPVWCTDTIPPLGYGHGFAVDVANSAVLFGGHHAGNYACVADVMAPQLIAAYGLVTAGLAVWTKPSVLDEIGQRVRHQIA